MSGFQSTPRPANGSKRCRCEDRGAPNRVSPRIRGIFAATLLLVTLAGSAPCLGSQEKSPTPSSQDATPLCPSGFVCLTVAEAREIAHELNELEKLRALAKVRKSRIIGLGLAVGPTAVICSETSGACLGATFGLTFRF